MIEFSIVLYSSTEKLKENEKMKRHFFIFFMTMTVTMTLSIINAIRFTRGQ